MQPQTDSRRARRPGWMITSAGLTWLVLLGSGPASATPMRCSSEQKTCITACGKNPDRSTIAACVTNCGSRNAYCMKTGCWVGTAQKYCGILKQ